MKWVRILAGGVLILASLVSALRYEWVFSLFTFLSPDGQIVPLMQLSLQLCLISLGSVGLVLLLFPFISRLMLAADRLIMQPDSRKFLWYALLTGLALRIIALVLIPFNQWADFKAYDELGWEWAMKGGYYNGDHLTAYWPPAYPFILSRIYILFGHVPQLGAVLNIPLSLGIILLTYLIVRKCWNEGLARWTAVIVVFFPSQILFTHLLASETPFTFLLLLSVLLFLSFDRKLTGRWYKILLGGIVLGLATLTRVISKMFLVLVIPFWLWETKDLSRTLKFSILALAGFLVVIVPWMVRNYNTFGVATINTNTGINLYIGNQPGSGMGYNHNIAADYDINNPMLEAYVDSSSWHKAWDYILAHPGSFLARGVLKVAFLYAADMDALQPDMITAAENSEVNYSVIWSVVAQSYYLLVIVAALIGLIVFFRAGPPIRNPRGYLLLGIILYWTAIHFVFYGMGRYHFPIIPIIAAFAALFIKSIVDKRIKIS